MRIPKWTLILGGPLTALDSYMLCRGLIDYEPTVFLLALIGAGALSWYWRDMIIADRRRDAES